MVSISREPLRPDPRAHLKAQPALFDQRQVKPADPLRYQRGYTPERMRDVRAATPSVDIPRYGEPPGAPTKEPCSTCGGQGHSPSFRVTGDMLKSPDMQAHWRERGIQHNGVVASAPGQTCWGCGGKGSHSVTPATNRGMAASLDHPFYQPGGHGERMMRESIARSTVPTSHLEGLQSILIPPERKVGTKSAKGALGQYTGSRQKGTGKVRLFPVPAKTPVRGQHAGERLIEDMDRPSSSLTRAVKPTFVPKSGHRQRQQSEATLIHEIGHHVSDQPAGPSEEARADRYMVTHYRPDPRDVKAGRALNPMRTTYLQRMGGPYTRGAFEATETPEPRPIKPKRVNVRRALLKDPFK
jgi:hypothetical protein